MSGDVRGQSYGEVMATKSTPSSQPKKPSRTLKEKRAAKQAKEEVQKHARKGWTRKTWPTKEECLFLF